MKTANHGPFRNTLFWKQRTLRLLGSYEGSATLLFWEERDFRQFLLLVRLLTVNYTAGDEGGEK